MKRFISVVVGGLGLCAGLATAEEVVRILPAPVVEPAAQQPAAPAKPADKPAPEAKPADKPAAGAKAEGKPAAGAKAEGKPDAKPAEVKVAPKPAVAVRRVGVVNVANAKAQRERQKQTIQGMPDGGTYKLEDIVHFTLVDGRIKAEWVGNFTAGQTKRIKIKGSDAVYTVAQFNQPPNSFYTFVRYDFDAPDDEFWMTNLNIQQANNMVTLSAQGADPNGQFTNFYMLQRPNGVTMNVMGQNRAVVSGNAPDLLALRRSHPDEVRKYLIPTLRRMTGQPMLRPGPADAYRVFTTIPADPKVTSRIDALLPALMSSDAEVRETAVTALAKLGVPGALAALRYDPAALAPEQANRLDELVLAHTRMPIDDPEAAAKDPDFLLDCLEDEDATIRKAALAALNLAMGKKLAIDADAAAAAREKALDAVRKQLAKARKEADAKAAKDKPAAAPGAPGAPVADPNVIAPVLRPVARPLPARIEPVE